jgi:HAD superfamily hydrolase (TIGR01509 family)
VLRGVARPEGFEPPAYWFEASRSIRVSYGRVNAMITRGLFRSAGRVSVAGMGYRGIILDVDGTLVDSNHAHAQAWVEAFRELGRPVPYERIRPLIGMGGDKLLPAAAGLSDDSPEGKAIAERRGEIFRARFLPRIEAFPGTRDLLQDLRRRGFRLAVASSAKEEELEPLLRIAGAHDLIESATSADDAESSKPDPDVIHAALQRLGRAPGEAVMIGDTPYDAEAARRGGVDCVGFRCGGWDGAALATAIAVYDGPWDLLRRLDESPLAQAS